MRAVKCGVYFLLLGALMPYRAYPAGGNEEAQASAKISNQDSPGAEDSYEVDNLDSGFGDLDILEVIKILGAGTRENTRQSGLISLEREGGAGLPGSGIPLMERRLVVDESEDEGFGEGSSGQPSNLPSMDLLENNFLSNTRAVVNAAQCHGGAYSKFEELDKMCQEILGQRNQQAKPNNTTSKNQFIGESGERSRPLIPGASYSERSPRSPVQTLEVLKSAKSKLESYVETHSANHSAISGENSGSELEGCESETSSCSEESMGLSPDSSWHEDMLSPSSSEGRESIAVTDDEQGSPEVIDLTILPETPEAVEPVDREESEFIEIDLTGDSDDDRNRCQLLGSIPCQQRFNLLLLENQVGIMRVSSWGNEPGQRLTYDFEFFYHQNWVNLDDLSNVKLPLEALSNKVINSLLRILAHVYKKHKNAKCSLSLMLNESGMATGHIQLSGSAPFFYEGQIAHFRLETALSTSFVNLLQPVDAEVPFEGVNILAVIAWAMDERLVEGLEEEGNIEHGRSITHLLNADTRIFPRIIVRGRRGAGSTFVLTGVLGETSPLTYFYDAVSRELVLIEVRHREGQPPVLSIRMEQTRALSFGGAMPHPMPQQFMRPLPPDQGAFNRLPDGSPYLVLYQVPAFAQLTIPLVLNYWGVGTSKHGGK